MVGVETYACFLASPSVWREWIEMVESCASGIPARVSLRVEGVD